MGVRRPDRLFGFAMLIAFSLSQQRKEEKEEEDEGIGDRDHRGLRRPRPRARGDDSTLGRRGEKKKISQTFVMGCQAEKWKLWWGRFTRYRIGAATQRETMHAPDGSTYESNGLESHGKTHVSICTPVKFGWLCRPRSDALFFFFFSPNGCPSYDNNQT